MIEHYKRLVSLVLEMHDEQIAEDGAHNPSVIELEAILLASHIRELEDNQNVLNQRESASNENRKYKRWRIYVHIPFIFSGWCNTSHAIWKSWPLGKYQDWTQ